MCATTIVDFGDSFSSMSETSYLKFMIFYKVLEGQASYTLKQKQAEVRQQMYNVNLQCWFSLSSKRARHSLRSLPHNLFVQMERAQ